MSRANAGPVDAPRHTAKKTPGPGRSWEGSVRRLHQRHGRGARPAPQLEQQQPARASGGVCAYIVVLTTANDVELAANIW
eukprot:SAG22_NODE_8753_length_632_cov_1.285178_2_plen_79_part_01